MRTYLTLDIMVSLREWACVSALGHRKIVMCPFFMHIHEGSNSLGPYSEFVLGLDYAKKEDNSRV